MKVSLTSRYVRIIGAGFLLLAAFLIAKKLFLYVVFTGVTALIIYYSKLYHFPVDVSPLFFLEIVIARYYGIGWTLLFILLGYIIPKTIAGSSMNWMSYIFIAIGLVPTIISMWFTHMPLLYVGFAASFLQYIGGVIFQSTMKPFLLSVTDGIANMTNNLLWFLILSDLIVMLLG